MDIYLKLINCFLNVSLNNYKDVHKLFLLFECVIGAYFLNEIYWRLQYYDNSTTCWCMNIYA